MLLMESSSVVIDIGSAWCKAGLAIENYPTLAVPSVVGYQFYEEEVKVYSPNILKACPPKIRKVVGLEKMRELKEMPNQFAIDRGRVLNWDAMEDIWYYSFDYLGIKTKNHPVLITEFPRNDENYRQKTLEIMMETFNVPSLHIGNQAELSLFGSGLLSGIVLDCGADLTHIAPIMGGRMIPECTLIHEIGGIDINIYLYDSIFSDTMTRYCLIKREAMDDLKEKLCYVNNFPDEKECPSDLASNRRRIYVLPDGNVLFLSEKLCTIPNIFFDPSEFGGNGIKLGVEVLKSAMACHNKTKAYIFSNVVLSGGSTLFPGFTERLSWELNAMKPLMYSTEVVSWPNRIYLPWVGGAILSRLSTFTSRCITREEYFETQSALIA
ncbi:actin-like protein 8 [Monodelphis domestica]|uniref:actin-like protein 8 n=1 Tax=Monodelphis domestica TaxID=13616 RepID=UPI0024E1BEDA|nr:actin-like protein 8 [Monodelphis domestica]